MSTGMKGHSTPMGVFSVIQKHKFHHSNIYSGAPMPYMQRITWSGVAMHAGVLPGYPASHGCIRMPMAFAVKMWNWTKMGARVIVTPGEMTPASFSHPLLVAQKVVPQPVDRRRAQERLPKTDMPAVKSDKGADAGSAIKSDEFRGEPRTAIDRRPRRRRSASKPTPPMPAAPCRRRLPRSRCPMRRCAASRLPAKPRARKQSPKRRNPKPQGRKLKQRPPGAPIPLHPTTSRRKLRRLSQIRRDRRRREEADEAQAPAADDTAKSERDGEHEGRRQARRAKVEAKSARSDDVEDRAAKAEAQGRGQSRGRQSRSDQG